MTDSAAAYHISALRRVVFNAIEVWNGAHPHPLRSHREHGTIAIAQAYVDGSETPAYSITVVCALAGAEQHVFHGHELARVAEHARLTLESKIVAELQRRADRDRDRELVSRFGVAV